MSHQTGIGCSAKLKQLFVQCKAPNTTVDLFTVRINQQLETLEYDHLMMKMMPPPHGRCSSQNQQNRDDWQQNLYKFCTTNNVKGCFYLFIRMDRVNTQTESFYWSLITNISSNASIRERMLYASTKQTLKQQFGTMNIEFDCHLNNDDDDYGVVSNGNDDNDYGSVQFDIFYTALRQHIEQREQKIIEKADEEESIKNQEKEDIKNNKLILPTQLKSRDAGNIRAFGSSTPLLPMETMACDALHAFKHGMIDTVHFVLNLSTTTTTKTQQQQTVATVQLAAADNQSLIIPSLLDRDDQRFIKIKNLSSSSSSSPISTTTTFIGFHLFRHCGMIYLLYIMPDYTNSSSSSFSSRQRFLYACAAKDFPVTLTEMASIKVDKQISMSIDEVMECTFAQLVDDDGRDGGKGNKNENILHHQTKQNSTQFTFAKPPPPIGRRGCKRLI